MIGGIELGSEKVPDLAVGLVFSLALLVLHHAALLIQLRLADGPGQMSHAVGLHPEREVESIGRDVLEIVGAVLVGGAVHVGGAGLLQRAEEILVVVLAAVEHQVLEQMSETGAARPLVLGADVIPDIHRDDRRLVILMDDQGQPVGQHEALKGNVEGGRRGFLGRQRMWRAGSVR